MLVGELRLVGPTEQGHMRWLDEEKRFELGADLDVTGTEGCRLAIGKDHARAGTWPNPMWYVSDPAGRLTLLRPDPSLTGPPLVVQETWEHW